MHQSPQRGRNIELSKMTARKDIFGSAGGEGTSKFYNWNPDMKYKSLPTRK